MGPCQSLPIIQLWFSEDREKHEERLTRRDRQYSKQKSLKRVSSRVFETRASTYDHVSNQVLTNFEGVQLENAGLTGLRNLGNTCFMASALQCLSNTIPLTDYFLGYDFAKEINHNNVLGTNGKLVMAYKALVKKIWLGNHSSVSPSQFKVSLEKFASQFKGSEQHDSHELLAFLLDGIHEDLNRVKNKPYIEEKAGDGSNDEDDAVLAWKNYLQRDRSIIVDLFQGQLRSEIQCRNCTCAGKATTGCGHKSVKFEPFMYLSLPFSDSVTSLDDCLDQFCAEELLTGDNKWYCTKCKAHVDASKKIELWALPPILIVHLKRFEFNQFGNRSKIEKSIRYPVTSWDLLTATRGGKTSRKLPKFDLYAAINHVGPALGSGHYTAYGKNRFDSKWYDFNDAACTKLADDPQDSSDLGNGSSCYLLFYNRMEETSAADKLRNGNPRVRRQSVDRPELWPHLQIMNKHYRSFSRQSVQGNRL